MTAKQGLFVIISSPTGGGKDSTIAELRRLFPHAARLITTTSRTPRPTDQQGVNYHFITKEDFEQKIKEGYFLEYNNFAGNYYGTPKDYLAEILATHELVLSNLDVNGKHSLEALGVPHLSIFLLPESLEVLKERAQKRGGINEEALTQRMQIAAQEIKQSKDYTYQITNFEGKLSETVEQIAHIIRERLSRNRT
jgi:guanylate kinase